MTHQHAVYLYNNSPKTSIGMGSLEIWTSTKSSYSAFIYTQPWDVLLMFWIPSTKMDKRSLDGSHNLEKDNI